MIENSKAFLCKMIKCIQLFVFIFIFRKFNTTLTWLICVWCIVLYNYTLPLPIINFNNFPSNLQFEICKIEYKQTIWPIPTQVQHNESHTAVTGRNVLLFWHIMCLETNISMINCVFRTLTSKLRWESSICSASSQS